MSIKLKVGKRYSSVSGAIVTIMDYDAENSAFPFIGSVLGQEPRFKYRWTGTGTFYVDGKHPFDLIAEYHEPALAGWITDRRPTEADAKPFPGLSRKELYVAVPSNEHPWWEPVPWQASGLVHSPRAWEAWCHLPEIPKFTPPPPEKKKVPLGLAEVPMLALLLQESLSDVPFVVLYRNAMSVFILNPHFDSNVEMIHYSELADRGIKISRDGGKTWEPCWKEVD